MKVEAGVVGEVGSEAPEAQPVIKAKSPKTKAKRPFPKFSIEESRKIADAIKVYNAGKPWTPQEIAKVLKAGGKTNDYFYLTAASRDYGLTVGTRDTEKIELAPLGTTLVYPKTQIEEANGVREAFRNVDLFKKVYDYYEGQNLPEIQYLKNTLKVEFGVDETFQDEFYELYQTNLAYLRSLDETASPAPRSPVPARGSDLIILGESASAGTLVAFVAMPFSEKSSAYPKGYFDEVLKHLITPAAVKAGFNAKTAKKAGSEVIQATIVNDLDSADLVIVDLTEHNPNVLFELGLRIAFNKPVCLIRAKGTQPIFDIDHMLRVFDYNPCLWPSTLEQDIPGLSEHIAATWANRDNERSYLSLLREN
jgi:hypothetical protein